MLPLNNWILIIAGGIILYMAILFILSAADQRQARIEREKFKMLVLKNRGSRFCDMGN